MHDYSDCETVARGANCDMNIRNPKSMVPRHLEWRSLWMKACNHENLGNADNEVDNGSGVRPWLTP